MHKETEREMPAYVSMSNESKRQQKVSQQDLTVNDNFCARPRRDVTNKLDGMHESL